MPRLVISRASAIRGTAEPPVPPCWETSDRVDGRSPGALAGERAVQRGAGCGDAARLAERGDQVGQDALIGASMSTRSASIPTRVQDLMVAITPRHAARRGPTLHRYGAASSGGAVSARRTSVRIPAGQRTSCRSNVRQNQSRRGLVPQWSASRLGMGQSDLAGNALSAEPAALGLKYPRARHELYDLVTNASSIQHLHRHGKCFLPP